MNRLFTYSCLPSDVIGYVFSSWPDGLLVNFTVGTVPNPASPIDRCDLWKQLMESLHQTNGVIGGGRLQVASDVELLNPCLKYSSGEPCAGAVCDMELGEVFVLLSLFFITSFCIGMHC